MVISKNSKEALPKLLAQVQDLLIYGPQLRHWRTDKNKKLQVKHEEHNWSGDPISSLRGVPYISQSAERRTTTSDISDFGNKEAAPRDWEQAKGYNRRPIGSDSCPSSCSCLCIMVHKRD
jgi:hypothetical protein